MAGKPRYAIKGVKGFSWLSILQHHDIVQGTAIDYMHGVLLGVQKLLLKLWFNNSYSKKVFSLYNVVSIVYERLKNISPTLDLYSLTTLLKTTGGLLLKYSLLIILSCTSFHHKKLQIQTFHLLCSKGKDNANICKRKQIHNFT